MKHLLNNISEEEKNSIREQHTGGIKLNNENFNKLVGKKLGETKPFGSVISEQIENDSEDNSKKEMSMFFDAMGDLDPSDFEDEFEYADNVLSMAVEKIMDNIEDLEYDEVYERLKDRYSEVLMANFID